MISIQYRPPSTDLRPLLDHSAFGRLDEADEALDVLALVPFRFELREGLRRVELRRQQHAICVLQLLYALLREAAALEPDRVQSISMDVARDAGLGERQYVLRDGRAATDVGVGADTHELMHRSERAEHRPFF